MPIHRLTVLARKFSLNEAAVRARLVHPVLVWAGLEAQQPSEQQMTDLVPDMEDGVQGRVASDREAAGAEPLVFVLDGSKTVGRTGQNDIVLPDKSVSRIHAAITRDPRSGHWHVVDKGSSNGTWLGSVRLRPNQPTPLGDGARVFFGCVSLIFLTPASLIEYVRQIADSFSPDMDAGDVEAQEVAPVTPHRAPEREYRFKALLTLPDLDALMDFYRLSMKLLDVCGSWGGSEPTLNKLRERSYDVNRVLRKLAAASRPRESEADRAPGRP